MGGKVARPLIYICYGMPKAGSTLAFNLTRAVLEDAGITQETLHAPGAISAGAYNYVEVIRPNELDALTDAITYQDNTPIAIKTHSGLWGCVERALADGTVRAQAICRDPRDIALSMIDAGKADAAWGRRNGAQIMSPQDALPAITAHVEKFARWAQQRGVLTLTYDTVAFDTKTAAETIARDLGVNINAERCARAALNAGNQFNKGLGERWRTEMSAADSALYESEFRRFFKTFLSPEPRPARKKGILRNLKRR